MNYLIRVGVAMRLLAIVLVGLVITDSAFAFDAEGFRSGMTVEEVSIETGRLGLTLRNVGAASYMAVKLKNGEIDAEGPLISFVFCHDALISIGHSIGVDIDYVAVAEGFIKKYGSAARVRVDKQLWTGPGGGYVDSVETFWYSGSDRAGLSFIPEGRTESGELRHYRHADISYLAKSACLRPDNW